MAEQATESTTENAKNEEIEAGLIPTATEEAGQSESPRPEERLNEGGRDVDATTEEMSPEETLLYTARAGSGTAGQAQLLPVNRAVKFFGISSTGDHVAYVVDRSSSMGGGRLSLAKTELLKSLKALAPSQNFSVVFFSDSVEANPDFIDCEKSKVT